MLANLLPLVHTFAAACDKPRILGLVPWDYYLKVEQVTIPGSGATVCQIQDFWGGTGATKIFGLHSPFLLIALAILDDLIRIAAFVAVGYVIYGGIQYITSQGAPDSTKKAQQTIINALIGVAVAIVAAAVVAFIGHRLGT